MPLELLDYYFTEKPIYEENKNYVYEYSLIKGCDFTLLLKVDGVVKELTFSIPKGYSFNIGKQAKRKAYLSPRNLLEMTLLLDMLLFKLQITNEIFFKKGIRLSEKDLDKLVNQVVYSAYMKEDQGTFGNVFHYFCHLFFDKDLKKLKDNIKCENKK